MDINSIADDIYRATITPRPANFKTTKERQIESMYHMYSQGLTAKEIAKIYDTTANRIHGVFQCNKRGYSVKVRKRGL